MRLIGFSSLSDIVQLFLRCPKKTRQANKPALKSLSTEQWLTPTAIPQDHRAMYMQVGRSRFWDGKWSKINHRPRRNVQPTRLRPACLWRNVKEGKSIQHMIYRNAILENNEQHPKQWSSKCHSSPHYSILILSSAVSSLGPVQYGGFDDPQGPSAFEVMLKDNP